MTHPRTLIRQALRARLLPHTGVSARVYLNQYRAVELDQVPCITIHAGPETAEKSIDGYENRMRLQIEAQLRVNTRTGADDALDALAEQAQSLLEGDATLGGLCDDFHYTGAEPVEVEQGENGEIARLSLRYECAYFLAPTATGDDWLTAHIDIDMASPRNDPPSPTQPDGQIDAADTLTLPA